MIHASRPQSFIFFSSTNICCGLYSIAVKQSSFGLVCFSHRRLIYLYLLTYANICNKEKIYCRPNKKLAKKLASGCEFKSLHSGQVQSRTLINLNQINSVHNGRRETFLLGVLWKQSGDAMTRQIPVPEGERVPNYRYALSSLQIISHRYSMRCEISVAYA